MARDLRGDQREPGTGEHRNHAELTLDSHNADPHHLNAGDHAYAHDYAHDDYSNPHRYNACSPLSARRKIRLLAAGRNHVRHLWPAPPRRPGCQAECEPCGESLNSPKPSSWLHVIATFVSWQESSSGNAS